MFQQCVLAQALLLVSSFAQDEVCLLNQRVEVARAGAAFPAARHLAPQASYGKRRGVDEEPSVWSALQLSIHALNESLGQDFDPFLARGGGGESGETLEGNDRVEYIWKHDVFAGKGHTARNDGDEGLNFFKAAPAKDWIVLAVTCVVLILIDIFCIQRFPDTFRWHMAAIAFWILVAAIFNFSVWKRNGNQKAFEWCSGYILEWMLSMDNLFVFHLIFKTYQTPSKQIHKAVFIGVIGAVAMRLVFFMVVSTLLRLFRWVRFPFGLLLIWSGVEAARGGDDDTDVKDTMLIRGLKSIMGARLQEEYAEEPAMFTTDKDGRLVATMLVIVTCCLEFTDILFAVDSVSAKVAQIPDQYIAFSSSVIAMYGLRAMFFLIRDLVEAFDLLQYGLCLILMFIGLELMFARYLHLASSTVCILIVCIFVICILGSQVKKKMGLAKADDDAPEAIAEKKPTAK